MIVERTPVASLLIIAAAAGAIVHSVPASAGDIRAQEWHLTFLRVKEAQQITTGAGITVAVVDTGVHPHPDVRKNLLKGTDVVEGGEGNGQVDQDGHGTEMAGLIASHGQIDEGGILGIAPSARILPIKDANDQDGGGSLTIADGVSWAASHGARVINVSAATGPSLRLNDAIEAGQKEDAVIVAGAGNRPQMLQFGYPAAMPGVLAVGAVDRHGRHVASSMTGPAVQICAPGVDIVTTEPPNKYVSISGTSPATAIVSGAAALVRAKFPQLSAQEVIHRLTATATDIGPPGRDDECGYGVLNIVKALTADVPPLSAATTASATPSRTSSALPPRAETPASIAIRLFAGSAVVVVLGMLAAVLLVRRRRSSAEHRGEKSDSPGL